MEKTKHKLPHWIRFLWILGVLVNIKSILADYDMDSSYAVAMSARHLDGDRMFREMWEPHQTSAYALDLFSGLFRFIRGEDPTGIVLFLHTVSVIVFALVIFLFFRAVKPVAGAEAAHVASVFLFVFRPKQLVLLEYTNLLLMGSILILSFFCLYFSREEGRRRYLIGLALSLCMTVPAYPSAVLLYPAMILILALYGKKGSKLRDGLILTGICAVLGLLYAGLFVAKMGMSSFIVALENILNSDASHETSEFGLKLIRPYELGYGLLWLLGTFAVSALGAVLFTRIRRSRGKDGSFERNLAVIFGIVLLAGNLILDVALADRQSTWKLWKFMFGVSFPVVMGTAALRCRKASTEAKRAFISGTVVSVAMCFSVWIFTNWPIVTVLGYLAPGVALAFPVLMEPEKTEDDREGSRKNGIFTGKYGSGKALAVSITLLLLSHRLILCTEYSSTTMLTFRLNSYVKTGPATGLVCSYMGAYQDLCDKEDFSAFLNAGDTLLILADQNVNSIHYMLVPGVGISHYSTISTPTYSEKLLEYWEQYPEKTPSVIAVNCWYGNLNFPEDTWIMQWIYENYEIAGDGRYYRFFRPKT